MGLQGPHSLIWWIQNELAATASIKTTQIQPMVRWGSVPFGAASWITPSTKAAIAAKAWTGIAGAASSNGARLMRSAFARFSAPDFNEWAQNGISSSMSLLRAPAATARRGALEGLLAP